MRRAGFRTYTHAVASLDYPRLKRGDKQLPGQTSILAMGVGEDASPPADGRHHFSR